MKTVKLLTGVSTKDATHDAGDVVDLDDAQAESLIEKGCAEAVNGAPAPALETAMQEPPHERATHPRGRGR